MDQGVDQSFSTLRLCGRYLAQDLVLVECMIRMNDKLGCVVKVMIKSEDEEVAANLIETIE